MVRTGRTRRDERWTVTIVPEGTPEEAERAARRVLELVDGWLRQDAGRKQADEESGS